MAVPFPSRSREHKQDESDRESDPDLLLRTLWPPLILSELVLSDLILSEESGLTCRFPRPWVNGSDLDSLPVVVTDAATVKRPIDRSVVDVTGWYVMACPCSVPEDGASDENESEGNPNEFGFP